MTRRAGLVLFGAGYWFAGMAGDRISADARSFGDCWAAAGVLFAVLWSIDRRERPAYAVVALLAGLAVRPTQTGAILAIGNVFQGWVGAILAGIAIGPPLELLTVRGVGRLALVVAPVMSAFGSAVGAPLIAGEPPSAWLREWVGDWLGVVCVAPVIVLSGAARRREDLFWVTNENLVEFLIWAAVYGAASVGILATPAESALARPYPIFGLMLWAALRFGPLWVAVAVTAQCFIAVGFGSRGTGPFATRALDPAARAMAVQIYLLVLGVTCQTLAAVVYQHRYREQLVQNGLIRLRAFLDHAQLAAWIIDGAGRHVYCNKFYEQLTGLSPDAVIGKSAAELFPPEVAREHGSNNEQVRRTKEVVNAFETFVRPDRQPCVLQVVKFLLDDPDHPGRLVALALDVSARQAQLDELHNLRQQYHGVSNFGHLYIAALSPDGRVLHMNKNFLEFARLPLEHVVGRPVTETELFRGVPPDQLRKLQYALGRAALSESLKLELPVRGADGREIILDVVFWEIFNSRKEVTQIFLQGYDITDFRKAQRELEEALSEKDTLLREVNHRVKNNLAVIGGLLGLQARRVTDPALAATFRDCCNRVNAIAAVHEMLYGKAGVTAVNWPAYVERLAHNLRAGYADLDGRVTVEVRADPISLDLENSVPVALILNELITNSLKHAFPEGRRGNIRVSIIGSRDGEITLRVADDGVGLPEDFDTQARNSLGLNLIRDLTQQIGGILKIDSTTGTIVTVRFHPQNTGADT